MLHLPSQKKERWYRHNVPDNMVQVIYRRGRYHRLASRHITRRWPLFEHYGSQVRVGIRSFDFTYKNVMSRDGVLHQELRAKIKIFFDIRNAASHLLPILAKNCEGVLLGRVNSLTEAALRRYIRRIASAKLLCQDTITEMENAIKKKLSQELEQFGVSLPSSEDAFYLSEILPPERIAVSRAEASNIIETNDNLAGLNYEQLMRILLTHFLRDVGTGGVEFKQLNLPEGLSPIPKSVDNSYRVLREPTGTVYSN